MAVSRKTVKLLPGIFQSDANKKFLGSTLDQLVSEPNFKKVNGYIGRTYGSSTENYLVEPNRTRQNYQLEVGLVTKNKFGKTENFANYQDLLNQITYFGGVTNNHDRLFNNISYAYTPPIDLDKLINYKNYYWLPAGPEEIRIGTKQVYPGTTYNFIDQSYAYTVDVAGVTLNPKLVLQRGVTYTFNVSSVLGNLFIQTEPTITGTKTYAPSVSSRVVAGVVNNGTSSITFTPPKESAQDFFLRFPQIDQVEYALDTTFASLDNVIWTFGDGMNSQLDGEQFYPDNTEIILLSNSTNNADWIDRTGTVVPANRRQGIWRIDMIKYSGQPARMQLTYVRSIPENTRIKIYRGLKQGKEYTVNSGQFIEFNGITAESSRLFYQHSRRGFYGEIELIDRAYETINVNNIIGALTYTTPDGITLSNGMKVSFDTTVTPSQYHNKTYIVEGVGTGIRLVEFDNLIAPEVVQNLVQTAFEVKQFDVGKFDETFSGSKIPDYIVINRSSIDKNAWSRVNRWFHKDVIIESLRRNGYQEDLSNFLNAQRPIIEFDADLQLFNSGRIFAGFVNHFYRNDFTYADRGQVKVFDNALAIISSTKFADLEKLGFVFSNGQRVIFSNDKSDIVRKKIYQINRLDQNASVVFDGILTGTLFIQNDRIIGTGTNFANQLEIGDDLYESNNSYIGRILEIKGNTEAILEEASNIIYNNISGVRYNKSRVTLAEIATVNDFDIVAVTDGYNRGKSFYYNQNAWHSAQQKTTINQAPLFDVIDTRGESLSTAYDNSNFSGSKVFSYKIAKGANDSVLEFPLVYSGDTELSGDILFDNNFDSDTFDYTTVLMLENKASLNVSVGFLRKITGRYSSTVLNNYTTLGENSRQYQHIKAEYDAVTNYFEIGKMPRSPISKRPNVKVFVNSEQLLLTNYDNPEYRTEYVGERVALVIDYTLLTKGDKIDIFVYADPTPFGYYEIPSNLENNPFNDTVDTISFGQLRNNLKKIGENNRFLQGNVFQSNNLRDLNYRNVPGTIQQHSASIVPALAFLTNRQINFINAIDYAGKEYTRFKNKFFDAINNYLDRDINEVPFIVDEILEKFTEIKTDKFAWHYSDMVPFGKRTNITNRRVTSVVQTVYNLTSTFSDSPSNIAVIVYVNNRILVIEKDYVINNALLTLTNAITLREGDVITIKEYYDTDGCYVPETPSKLGLYPKYTPEKIFDESYSTPIYVIQGHDGSIVPAFNDIRDLLILELETRIYNNIKVRYTERLFNRRSHIPGRFRTTEYSRNEFNSVLSLEFLRWVGENSLDYTTNSFFNSNDEWSWNYSQARDLDNNRIPGYWRGIYRYYFDTDRPHTHPWEMLGYTIKPKWWDDHYSWQDTDRRASLIAAIENGRISSPASSTYLTTVNISYARAGFGQVVPVDANGRLLPPQQVLISGFDSARLSGNFSIGDYGPVEAAWARSSDYAFAEQRAFALLKPAQYFGLYLDSYNTTFNSRINQYVIKGTSKRLDFRDTLINGETKDGATQRAASYINWIHGYLVGLGIDAGVSIRDLINNSELNLAYKFGGFTNKNYINVLANQISLSSKSRSLVIPEESYSIYLNKSLPIESISYSAVIIERTSRGFSVNGYDQKFPYFTIIPSQTNGTSLQVNVLGENIVFFEKFLPQKIKIPYGFEFVTLQQVADFLVSYQRYLSAQGIVFDTYDENLQQVRNFSLSVQEFVTWAKQGWDSGNILVLSPIVDTIHVYSQNFVVDHIDNYAYGSQLLGTNSNIIRNNDFTVLRDNKRTTISTISGQTIGMVRLNLVQYEHVLLLDNISIFNDILYKPEVGDRQQRLKIVGSVTNSWDGELTPPGFVYSDGDVDQWQANYDYKKGEIVQYKSRYYSALRDIDGSDSFNFSYWARLDSSFREGLLSNFSQNAAIFTDIYDVDLLPYDENLTVYSNSLIGYRTRSYLNNLGLDSVSQIKFYQGFIRDKGTMNAVTAFERGVFNNVENAIEIYEEWGARLGVYGSIDNNPEFSFIIKNSIIDNNPLIYQMVDKNQKPENELTIGIKPRDLLLYPDNYSRHIFRNRNVLEKQLWRIELFGDSTMCGKQVETDRYAVDVVKRHGYSIDVRQKSGYSVSVTGPFDQNFIKSLDSENSFQIYFTSAYPNEPLFVSIETPTANDRELSTMPGDELIYASTDNVSAGTELSLFLTSNDIFEPLYVSLEPALYPDVPLTSTAEGITYSPDELLMGQDFFVEVTSLFEKEDVYWSIEEVAEQEQPGVVTLGLGDINTPEVCLRDKVTGRVAEPPDFLLFKNLEKEFDLAVLTRSVGNSTSGTLLQGTDGVNGPWPDGIEAEIVVINHGLNDARNGVSVVDYKNNLKQLRELLPKEKIVIWQTPINIDISNPYTNFMPVGTNNLSLYAKAMTEVANDYGDYIVDVYNYIELKNHLDIDGIHPTQEGYRLIVEELLQPVVRQAINDQILSQFKYYEDDIKSAGYPLLEEVDSLVFDIRKYAEFDSTLLSSLSTGYKIWVAKDFDNDWQVYRSYIAPVKILSARSDLDNKLIITTSFAHNCKPADMIAIRGVDTAVDGFYQIFNTTELEITVVKSGLDIDFEVSDKSADLIDLERLRFKNLTELKAYKPKYGWMADNKYALPDGLPKDNIYVDEVDSPNSWSVYRPSIANFEYQNVFYSNLLVANIYNIVGINCEIANSIVNSAEYEDVINFCVFSASENEDLYYTIETPTEEDLARDAQIGGELITVEENTTSIESVVYDYIKLRSANLIVDIESINNIYLYNNKNKQILSRVDLFDPAKGRILSAARAEIDVISNRDPASYRNTDSTSDLYWSQEVFWGQDQVGTYWWNTDSCRYLDYEQGNLKYRIDNWGAMFPGSKVQVYEWYASDVLPTVHVARGLEGEPLYPNNEYYTDTVYLDKETGSFKTKYFFWVRSRSNKSAQNKTHSTVSLESMIRDPLSHGYPYMAALRDDAVAVYNAGSYLAGDETTIYISSKLLVTDQIIHSDYVLLQDGNPLVRFPEQLEKKLIDSVVGSDKENNLVPNPLLLEQKRIGLGISPNQTLISDRQRARKNLIKYINDILIQYPVVTKIINDNRIFSDNFFASEDEPEVNSYTVAVDTKDQIYNPEQIYPVIKILVRNDSSLGGLWGLYSRTGVVGQYPTPANTTLSLIRKQSFDVTQLWEYHDWYLTGYDNKTLPDHIVGEFKDIYRLSLKDGDIVLVKNAGNTIRAYGNIINDYEETLGDWEMYRFNASPGGRFYPVLIGLAKKTIQILDEVSGTEGFDSFDFDVDVYDNRKDLEFRYILLGLKEEIFINELKDEYTKMLFSLVDYILAEQKYIDWFFKTSFISVKHITKQLSQITSTINDYQKNVEDYVSEIKPYRTKIREFIAAYENIEVLNSAVTDFDLPAYYDSELGIYRSPDGTYPDIDLVRIQRPEYAEWRANHRYSIDELQISRSGYGYQNFVDGSEIVPDIEILRTDINAGTEANAVVKLDTNNFGINKVYMERAGENYTSTPIVKVIGVGSNRPKDDDKYVFTVVSQGYSYFTNGRDTKLSFGLYGNFDKNSLIKNTARSSIKVSEWTTGYGSLTNFIQNGTSAENFRVRDTDPWQMKNIVWETRPAGDGNSDGGYTTTYFAINPNKTYRSAVWMRRNSGTSSGMLFHGLYTDGSWPTPAGSVIPTGSVRRLVDGQGESDPVWNARNISDYSLGEWYLHIGYIFPRNHTGITNHPDSGIYTRSQGRVYSNTGTIDDGKFPPNATQAMQRVYHNYSTNTSTRAQFAYPRFEEVDGTEPAVSDLLDYGPYADVKWKTRQRGYHMHRIRRADGHVAFSRFYDAYLQNNLNYTGYTTADLVRDLNATTDDYVVVVHTYDEPKNNRLSNNLHLAMQRCGASVEVFGKPGISDNFKFRSSYILVGIPGCGTGRGIEHYAGSGDNTDDAYCSISFRIEKGYFAALSSDPRHYVFAQPFNLPAGVTKGQTYTYGERSWVYDGFHWRGTKVVTPALPTSKMPGSAILTPKLTNKTVRKVNTTLKFDRVQYTTKIREWTPFSNFIAGEYISYQGRAYFVNTNFSSTNVLEEVFVSPVAAKDFDNANDRTMGFYVQTEDNVIPKVLYQLIPGINPLNPVIVGNVRQVNDTILVGDTFGSNVGISSGNIKVAGGKFVDRLFSHSPEELLPGTIYDSLSIRVAEIATPPPTPAAVTTAGPPGPKVLQLVGNTESTIEVPFVERPVETSDSFAVGINGGEDGVLNNIVIDVIEAPKNSSVTIVPNTFSLLSGQQKQVFFRTQNVMLDGNVWYDLTSNQNNFALLDNSPIWNDIVRGNFKFNFGANIKDRASSITSMTGINTTPGGYNTVNMWMRWRAGGDTGGFPMEWKTGYRLWMPGGALGFNNGAGDLYGVSSSTMDLYKDSWVFVSAVFHNTTGGSTYVGFNKLYINGIVRTLTQVQPPATSGTAGIGITWANNTNPISTPDSYEFDGDISEVFVYNKELSASEIESLYYATRSRYPSPPTTTTTTSTTTTTTTGPSCGLAQFDANFTNQNPGYNFGTPVSGAIIHYNEWIKYSVNGVGTGALGQGGTVPGLQFAPNGDSNYGGDFIAPGYPWEGFCFEITQGGTKTNFGGDNINQLTGSATAYSIAANHTVITKSSAVGDLVVEYKTLPGEPIIRIRMAYKNTTASEVSVRACRGLDPDNGGTFSKNTRGFGSIPATDIVNSVGPQNAPLSLYTSGNGYNHNAAVFAAWPSYNIDVYLAGGNDGDGDFGMGVGWDIGKVAAGATVAVTCYYVCSPNPTVVETLIVGCPSTRPSGVMEGTAGSGGGGGGGSLGGNETGGGGGGVGLFGQGASGGSGGVNWNTDRSKPNFKVLGGEGGSGGDPGAIGTGANAQSGNGGKYGGGGGGADRSAGNRKGGDGGDGAIRIIWGTGRSFPINAASDPAQEAIFDTPGQQIWIPPAGVTSVCVVLVGGGGAGAGFNGTGGGGEGGGGGALAWKNNISVTAGTPYTLVVAAGGKSDINGHINFGDGEDSTGFGIVAGGGKGGLNTSTITGGRPGKPLGGVFTGTTTGGNGGEGGTHDNTTVFDVGAGGGGAGGYAGAGGKGGSNYSV